MRRYKHKRHYVHGDQHESDAQSWYCAACDCFAPSSHFRELCPCPDHEAAQMASARQWRALYRAGTMLRRPPTATNCFVQVSVPEGFLARR